MDPALESLRGVVVAVRDALTSELGPPAAYALGIRLVALRAAEARGIVEAELARGDAAATFARATPLCPRLFEGGGTLAREAPPRALRRAIDALVGAGAGPLRAPEALGWAHQFWNAPEKDRVFAALKAGGGRKLEAADLVPATQLYTERHLVDFLLENSLGAAWLGAHPSSKLAERMPWLVRGAEAPRSPPRAASSFTVLDPACGTGHFLLRAFELLFAMYQEEGALSPRQIAASILEHNLRGLDLDADAVALAEAALLLLCAERAPGFEAREVAVVACDVALGDERDALDAHVREHPEDAGERDELRAIYAALARADALGALVPLDDDPRAPIARARRRALDRFASSHPRARRVVEMLRARYDVVAMNPPYAGFRRLAPALRELVARDELARLDLFVAFLRRGFALLVPGGALAAITPASWTTSSKTEPLRRTMLAEGGPSVVVALGQRVFDTAPLLFVSLQVIRRASRPALDDASFMTLRAPSGSGADGLARAIREGGKRWPYAIAFGLESRPFLPTAPLELLEKTRGWPTVGDFFTSTDGVWSGENDRDVREGWELPAELPGWTATSGGQGYARWYAPTFRRVRTPVASGWIGMSAREAELPTFEYARVAGGKLSARLVRRGTAAIAGVVTMVPRPDAPRARIFEALALFNARVGTAWLATLTSGLNFNPGYAARIPLAPAPPDEALEAEVLAACALKRSAAAEELASDDLDPALFEASLEPGLAARAEEAASRGLGRALSILELEAKLEARLQAHLGLSDASWAEIGRALGEPAACLPRTLPEREAGRDASADEQTDDDEVPQGWPSETELEDVARTLGAHPRTLLEAPSLPAKIHAEIAAMRGARAREHAMDVVTVLALRCFGHRFAHEPLAPPDGPAIWPLGTGEGSLGDAVRARVASLGGDVRAFERDFEALAGVSLGAFLEEGLVERHIRAFRRRPVLWQLASRAPKRTRPAFACVIHAHRIGEALAGVRALVDVAARGQDEELDRFRAALEELTARGFATSGAALEGQLDLFGSDERYAPNVEDGVRVNVAPLQRAGLLAIPILAPPDVERAIADRARWRGPVETKA